MATKSASSRLIDRVIAIGPAPVLKAAGYRKVARAFYAEAGGLFKVVHFQASMWNTPDSGSFTVNLNIVLPYFHEKWTGRAFARNPGSAQPVITKRIGHLTPERCDRWWEVTPKSNVDRVAAHVARAVSQRGLPFLDEHASVGALTQAVQHKDAMRTMLMSPELGLAILLRFQGKLSRATRVVQELARRNKYESFANTIRLIAGRLRLKVAL